ncbi:ABSCISIC ACID-INSENSITIVE 5-like protein 1 [Prosopis cineraria]|uniref:ABSCISIC ACID-INSENSITIVE 5-like protein 1 n=1 Tax=Prosopis cineraria TaxID=364024 RepID=UPI002410730F|nr:ABSCISIC ACID-INSENSITIVE 5-like protein 1 [Prosopis cineraria]
MLVSETETVASDKNHSQQLAPSSLSLPLPQLQQELPSKETSIYSPTSHQNSIPSLTLDEIQSKSVRMVGSMSMDEFLANIWNSDDNQIDSPPPPPPPPTRDELPVQNKNAGAETETVISQQASLSVPPPICKKTVDEVWSEIRKDHRSQQNAEATNDEISASKSLRRQQTLGEMTLEDFLIKAGIVQESPLPSLPLKFSWPQQSSSSLPFQNQTGNITNNRPFDASYKMGPATRMGFSTQQNVGVCLSGDGASTYRVLSQSHSLAAKEPATSSAAEKCQTSGEPTRNSSKKRIIDGPPEVVVERRQRRMLKNRESAARSRARRQAYTVELEAGLNQLRQENEQLKEILAEAERKRKQEMARKKRIATKAQKMTEKFRAIRRTVSAAW